MSIHMARPEHEVTFQDLANLMRKHADKLSALDLLAVGANMLGKLIALQDKRTTSPEVAMEVVSANIEHGNKTIIELLASRTGGTA